MEIVQFLVNLLALSNYFRFGNFSSLAGWEVVARRAFEEFPDNSALGTISEFVEFFGPYDAARGLAGLLYWLSFNGGDRISEAYDNLTILGPFGGVDSPKRLYRGYRLKHPLGPLGADLSFCSAKPTSWSSDLEIARSFAWHYELPGLVLEAEVSPKDICLDISKFRGIVQALAASTLLVSRCWLNIDNAIRLIRYEAEVIVKPCARFPARIFCTFERE